MIEISGKNNQSNSKVRIMIFDPISNAITIIIGAPTIFEKIWYRLSREEKIIKLLDKLHLNHRTPPEDFDGIYIYTLVNYGIDKEEPILEFFRSQEIREAFKQFFKTENLSDFLKTANDFIERYKIGDELKELNFDPSKEFNEFNEIFISIIPFKPETIVQSQDLKRHIDARTEEIIETIWTQEGEKQEMSQIDWDKYLNSVFRTYQDWWKYYILTDVESDKYEKAGLEPPFIPFDLDAQLDEPDEKRKKREEGEFDVRKKREKINVLDGIRKYSGEHVLLVGRPGSGKTTALWRLLLEEAQKAKENKNSRIPVLVELKYFKTSTIDLINDFLYRHGINLEAEKKDEIIKSLLSDGKLILLIDGLNELPSEEARRELRIFRENNKTVPMIFTTRELGMGGDFGISKRLEMSHLTEVQIKEFVLSYLPEVGDRMLKCLSGRLKELARTPLFLLMLCSIFKAKQQIPRNLGLVFREFTKKYEQSKEDFSISVQSRRLWPQILEYLAFKMMESDVPTELRLVISRDEAEEIILTFLEKKRFRNAVENTPVFLDDLLKYHLIQTAPDEKIEFRHQMLQEYYAAEYLSHFFNPHSKIQDDEFKRKYLNYLKWTQSIAIMCNLIKDREQALRIVRLAIDVDIWLAARLAGAVREEFQADTVNLISELEVPMEFKIDILSKTRSEEAVSKLQEFIADKDSGIRSSAVDALGEIGYEKAIVALTDSLKDKVSDVRQAAAWSLGKIGGEKVINALLVALKDKVPSVRMATAVVLGEIGYEKAVGALAEALNGGDLYVRWNAAIALGKIGGEKAVDALLKALNDEDLFMMESTAFALNKIGSEKAINALLKALYHGDLYERWSAAIALGKIGGEKAVDVLLEALKDEYFYIRLIAAEVLGEIGDEKAVDALLDVLRDEDSDVRGEAVRALTKIHSEKAGNALLKALENEDFYVMQIASEALGEIGSEKAVNALLKALQDEDSDVREQAVIALGEICSEKAYNALLKALQDEDFYVSLTAAEILGESGGEKALDVLLKALKDEPVARWRAVDALGRINGEKVIDALLDVLRDEDWVGWRAAAALGKVGNPELITYFQQRKEEYGYNIAEPIIHGIQERCRYYNPELV